ncbi:MAG: Lar family restriction alleviation protein [Pseudomonadota bacterium]
MANPVSTTKPSELLPCPFCGGGTTDIEERRLNNTPRMDGRPSAVISATVFHWCPVSAGQPSGLNVSMHGRDRASAIAAWNTRAALNGDS